MRKQNYVGLKSTDEGHKRERFLTSEPMMRNHGDRYSAIIGPFRTKLGALCCVHFGYSNPYLITTADCERVGRKHKDELKDKPDSLFIPY